MINMAEKRNCASCKHFQIDGMFGTWCDINDTDYYYNDNNDCLNYENNNIKRDIEMTDKRFINDIKYEQLVDTKGELSTINYRDSVDFYELWEFLNKLNDENEQLKKENERLKSKNKISETIIDTKRFYVKAYPLGYSTGYYYELVDIEDELTDLNGNYLVFKYEDDADDVCEFVNKLNDKNKWLKGELFKANMELLNIKNERIKKEIMR